MALNRTARVNVMENGTVVVANASLVNGTILTFAGGSLSFTDADGDGYLSTGDYFTLRGTTTAWYHVQVTVLFGDIDRTVFI